MSETGALVSRVYGAFRGVDFRGEEIDLPRSPNSLNVWKDYKETDSIRTRPGMKRVHMNNNVNGIFFYKGAMLIHSGTKLYKDLVGVTVQLKDDLNNAVSDAFVYEGIWYFKDGKNYLQYDGQTIKEVEGYVPTTSIGRKPTDGNSVGGGTTNEDINMLSDYRKNTFLGDSESTFFYLDTKEIDDDFPVKVTISIAGKDTPYEAITVDYKNGVVEFNEAPPVPDTVGQDNVTIEFKKSVSGYKERILGCTLLQVFDNRVFFSGNPNYPNFVWHCSLNDPTYCSDLDYYQEGLDSAKVTGLVAGNNALWVFREPSDANTTVFYHAPTIDSDYGKIYPSQHSSITTGCVGKAINFNDDIIFFSDRGMEGISGDITTEQAVAHRSSLVDRKMTAEPNYKNMILAEWEGYLFVFIGSKAYLADSRTAFANEGHAEYEWFYWDLGMNITCARVHDGVLYLGTATGVYALTDHDSDVESYWVTPKDKFLSPHKLKTTNKRGCVVEAKGDISVYAKLEDTDFELIGTYENITDYFVSRIKRKKWKDIQLKFYSKTRFSLETATLEAFVGGYIKR